MKRITTLAVLIGLAVMFAVGWNDNGAAGDNNVQKTAFTDSFMLGRCKGFSSTGRNPFFILEPGYKLILRGVDEDGAHVRLAITVLDETKTIEGIETRVVEERETADGELAEVSRNFFAICNRNNSVFYFGERTDIYENGMIVSHEGSWQAGVNGASPGLIMPGTVLLGSRYFNEVAPGVALDQVEIVRIDAVVQTPAGKFKNCLKTKEGTPLEPGVTEFKFYAPGVGIIQDETLKLVKIINP